MTVTLLELLDGLEELAEDLEELADELDVEEGSASDTVPETMISSGGASREVEELTAEEEGAAELSGTEDAAEEELEEELGAAEETGTETDSEETAEELSALLLSEETASEKFSGASEASFSSTRGRPRR